jgi:diguanylate cyclase (GGDEF)-like protein
MNTSRITMREFLMILQVSRRLSEQRMVEPLIAYVAATVFDLVAAESCLIIFFNHNGTLDVRCARDHKGNPIPNAGLHVSRSILQQVQNTLEPMIVSDALSDAVLQMAESVHSLQLRSVMCVPLVTQGRAVGVIYVENRSMRGQFRDEHIEPLVLFAYQVVAALENAYAYEVLEARVAERTQALQAANTQLARQAAELRELSIRDSLTGLYNRRYFTEILQQQFAALRRLQRPLAVACIDIDGFKQINDTFLHAGGDRALVAIGRILQAATRTADTVARIGGEEFAIMLPDTLLADAAHICERLRADVAAYDWDSIAASLRVTISLGVAEAAGHPDEAHLLRAADALLYRAKRQGKNQVVAGTGAIG